MAASRSDRESLLKVLVAFMRGEIKSDQFDEQRIVWEEECRKSQDEGAAQVCFLLWHFYDDVDAHPISVSPEQWDALRRYAAFLKTDLELETIVRWRWHGRQWLGILGLPMLVMAGVVLFGTGSWLPLAVVWLVLGVGWVIIRQRCEANDEVRAMWRFAPFWSEEQWRRYEPLAHKLDLPAYDPLIRNRPIRTKAAEYVLWVYGVFLGTAFLPITLLWNCFPGRREAYMVACRG
jgi:hypothetical protein